MVRGSWSKVRGERRATVAEALRVKAWATKQVGQGLIFTEGVGLIGPLTVIPARGRTPAESLALSLRQCHSILTHPVVLHRRSPWEITTASELIDNLRLKRSQDIPARTRDTVARRAPTADGRTRSSSAVLLDSRLMYLGLGRLTPHPMLKSVACDNVARSEQYDLRDTHSVKKSE